jgi:predicted nucleic acid-binding Zn ribbon protein
MDIVVDVRVKKRKKNDAITFFLVFAIFAIFFKVVRLECFWLVLLNTAIRSYTNS